MLVDGEPVSASLFDFGLAVFHNAREQLERGTGPYFYLPKLESHLEARLWNDAFVLAQDELGIPQGSIKATVLIETILAAFEMEEILYELREHSAGLNAGRWDYIFSVIKKFRERDFVLPGPRAGDHGGAVHAGLHRPARRTCHRRGAHAIGGMAAFIPSRRDPEVNEVALAKVREDKERESRQRLRRHLGRAPRPRAGRHRDLRRRARRRARTRSSGCARTSPSSADDLLDFEIPGGEVTERASAPTSRSASATSHSWLNGVGAAAIDNLMEDAATAEISRSQVWQWVRHGRFTREQRARGGRRGTRGHGAGGGAVRAGRARRRVRRVPDAAGLRATRLRARRRARARPPRPTARRSGRSRAS